MMSFQHVDDIIPINRSMRLSEGQYVADPQVKDLIVLHATAGASAKSSFDWWEQTPERIATAFIIDRDGTIYEVFDPRHYAWHIGEAAPLSATKRSVGIELCNWGPLRWHPDGKYRAWPKGFTKPVDIVGQLPKAAYRGESFYEPYPEAQQVSCAKLCAVLVKRLKIPELVINDFLVTMQTKDRWKAQGIVSHSNLRSDKWDIGPMFPSWKFSELYRQAKQEFAGIL